MQTDKMRNEATFQLAIENFSQLSGPILSNEHYVRGFPWTILVKSCNDSTGDEDKTLGFFLKCNADPDKNWKCSVTFDLRLLSFRKEVPSISRQIHHVFSQDDVDWGFSNFSLFFDIMHPESSYYQNDTIILEVYMRTEEPSSPT